MLWLFQFLFHDHDNVYNGYISVPKIYIWLILLKQQIIIYICQWCVIKLFNLPSAILISRLIKWENKYLDC